MRVLGFFVLCLLQATPPTFADGPTLDLLICRGRIVDGTGSPWYIADIGIVGDKIVRIGNIPREEAKEVIEAEGLVVAPGFIDMMGQTATPMCKESKYALNLLTQGVTTINAGEGSSDAPLDSETAARRGYSTMFEYLALLEMKGLPLNVVQTVGHTQVRRIVLGDVDRRPSDEELTRMKELVREGMEAGAIGLSTALIYPPAIYAPTKEIAELAAVAGEYGGGYFTHMRNEGDQLLEAIDEAMTIGREAQTPVHIFHLKAAGRQNWGKLPLAIATIQAARSAGQQVTADIYPYVNNGLGIAALIHPRHFAEGREALLSRLDAAEVRDDIRREMEESSGWENWYRHAGSDWNRIVVGSTDSSRYRQHQGETVAQLAQRNQEDPWETFFNLVRAGAFVLPETMSDANKILAIQQEFTSFCTDVGPAGGDRIASHPRAFGSFPRLLSRYVRDLGAISLERAVAQASAGAANKIFAYDRGRISVGLAADIIVFDYDELADRATFSEPDAVSVGMRHVIVNGKSVLKDGELTGRSPGRVLRGPGYRESQAAYNVAAVQSEGDFKAMDDMIRDFMKEHRVPGLSIALTDQGEVQWARGYGYADLASREPVTTASLFRIASLSKPITAVAILQLVDKGMLELDAPVFEVLDMTGKLESVSNADPRLAKITVRHLLEHRGGWDRDASFDAMFRSVPFADQVGVEPPADQATVIQAMWSQPLDFDPGERYAYSNFGYCLLGRVIEKLTHQPYDEYVKKNVLEPVGVTAMRIGATQRSARALNEVCYYKFGQGKSVFKKNLSEETPWPYGAWCLEAMDSHGGWIASATDLAKLAAALDDVDHSPLLSRSAMESMYARPQGLAAPVDDGAESPVYYSLGWNNRVIGQAKINHWHTGSLDGTSTIMIRRHDGKNMVALLNTRDSPSASHLGRAIDGLLHRLADRLPVPEIAVE